MLRLPEDELDLLKQCLEKRSPDLLWTVTSDNIFDIDEDLGTRIRSILFEEFGDFGIDDTGETNDYGRELDSLMDLIGEQMWSTND